MSSDLSSAHRCLSSSTVAYTKNYIQSISTWSMCKMQGGKNIYNYAYGSNFGCLQLKNLTHRSLQQFPGPKVCWNFMMVEHSFLFKTLCFDFFILNLQKKFLRSISTWSMWSVIKWKDTFACSYIVIDNIYSKIPFFFAHSVHKSIINMLSRLHDISRLVVCLLFSAVYISGALFTFFLFQKLDLKFHHY